MCHLLISERVFLRLYRHESAANHAQLAINMLAKILEAQNGDGTNTKKYTEE